MLSKDLKNRISTEIQDRYTHANRVSRGILGILVDAVQSFIDANAGEGAASIAYYALFSLFPLLIFLVSTGSIILQSAPVQEQVLGFTGELLPSSQQFVANNIQQILELRGTAGVVAVVGLLWAATGVFTVLARHINRAWHTAELRNFWQGRLIGLALVAALTVLLFLSLITSTIFGILSQFQIDIPLLGGRSLYQSYLWTFASSLIPWVINFAMFIALYWWIPNTLVKWKAAAWGAVAAAFAWEIIKRAFGWYISSGLNQFDIAYGSVATVVVLLLWIYLSSLIVLFGAHLSAAVARHSESLQDSSRKKARPPV